MPFRLIFFGPFARTAGFMFILETVPRSPPLAQWLSLKNMQLTSTLDRFRTNKRQSPNHYNVAFFFLVSATQ